MKKIITLAIAVAGGLVAIAGIGHVAHAQPSASLTVAVHYGDLDIASAAGRSTLDQRIRQAVRTACGDPSPADLRGANAAAACRRELAVSLASERDSALAAARAGLPRVLVARR